MKRDPYRDSPFREISIKLHRLEEEISDWKRQSWSQVEQINQLERRLEEITSKPKPQKQLGWVEVFAACVVAGATIDVIRAITLALIGG